MSKDGVEVPKQTRVNFWIPEQQFRFLETVAKRDGRSMSDVFREAIRDLQIKDKKNQELLSNELE